MLWVPSSPYAATKYAGELLVTSYNEVYSLPTLNLRFFMVGCAVRQHWGASQPPHLRYLSCYLVSCSAMRGGCPFACL